MHPLCLCFVASDGAFIISGLMPLDRFNSITLMIFLAEVLSLKAPSGTCASCQLSCEIFCPNLSQTRWSHIRTTFQFHFKWQNTLIVSSHALFHVWCWSTAADDDYDDIWSLVFSAISCWKTYLQVVQVITSQSKDLNNVRFLG